MCKHVHLSRVCSTFWGSICMRASDACLWLAPVCRCSGSIARAKRMAALGTLSALTGLCLSCTQTQSSYSALRLPDMCHKIAKARFGPHTFCPTTSWIALQCQSRSRHAPSHVVCCLTRTDPCIAVTMRSHANHAVTLLCTTAGAFFVQQFCHGRLQFCQGGSAI